MYPGWETDACIIEPWCSCSLFADIYNDVVSTEHCRVIAVRDRSRPLDETRFAANTKLKIQSVYK